MSAFANLVLHPDDADAVDQTFEPRTKDGNLATWRLSGSGMPYISEPHVSMSVTSTNSSPVIRTRQKVVVPIMSTVDTAKKVGELIANIEFIETKDSSPEVREMHRNLVRSLIASSVTADAVEKGQGIF